MAKLTLNDILSGYATATAYNANNELIEAALENTLSRDGTAPNAMGADLDMNSYNVNNADSVNCAALQINGVSVVPGDTLTVPNAVNVPFTPSGNIVATDVGGALQELDTEKVAKAGDTMTGSLTVPGLTSSSNVSVTGNISVTGTVDGIDVAARDAILTEVYNTRVINAARIHRNSNQVLSHGFGGQEFISWEAAAYENVDVWDIANPTRITIPAGYSYVRLVCFCLWESASDYEDTLIQLFKNGSSILQESTVYDWRSPAANAFNPTNQIDTGWLECTTSDYYEILAQQSNATLDTRYIFAANAAKTWVQVELRP